MLTAKDFIRGSCPKAPARLAATDGGGEGQLVGDLTQRDDRRGRRGVTHHKSQITIIENEFFNRPKGAGAKNNIIYIIYYIIYIILKYLTLSSLRLPQYPIRVIVICDL